MVKSAPILKAENVTFSYPGQERKILKNVYFSIERQERTVLLGPNGAGKSTLMFNLLGIYTPGEGEIYFKQKLLNDIDEDELRQQVSYIFQNPDDQIFAPTVREDILFGPTQFAYDQQDKMKKLEEISELLKIEHLLDRNPQHLSYGEKRRVALAGILILNPDLILLDEPLAFLDPPGRKLFTDILKELSSKGKTIIIATHDLNFAAEWGEKYLVLNQNGTLSSQNNKDLFKKGIKAFNDSLPLTSQIFKGFVPTDKLPVTVKESRKMLEKEFKK